VSDQDDATLREADLGKPETKKSELCVPRIVSLVLSFKNLMFWESKLLRTAPKATECHHTLKRTTCLSSKAFMPCLFVNSVRFLAGNAFGLSGRSNPSTTRKWSTVISMIYAHFPVANRSNATAMQPGCKSPCTIVSPSIPYFLWPWPMAMRNEKYWPKHWETVAKTIPRKRLSVFWQCFEAKAPGQGQEHSLRKYVAEL
jgi:hypothetical protein